MGYCRQLSALLRKNFLLKWRAPGTTLAEILLPVFIMLVIELIRGQVSRGDNAAMSHMNDHRTFSPMFYSNLESTMYFYQQSGNGTNSAQNAEKIAFIPTNLVGPIVKDFNTKFPMLAPLVITYDTIDEMTNYMAGPYYGSDAVQYPFIQAGISFNKLGSASDPTWDYNLHLNFTQDKGTSSTLDTSQSAVNVVQISYDNTWLEWWQNREMFLQDFVESYILEQALFAATNSSGSVTRRTTVVPFPTPAYILDDFASFVAIFLGLLFTVVFLWPVTRIIKVLVEEKENRIKEGMKMMGLDESVIWMSWLITYFIIFLVMCILIVLVSPNVFKYSNKGTIFFFFWIYTWSIFAFCYLMSCFFSSARTASTFGALLFLGVFFPYYAVYGSSTAESSKTAACLSSPIAFALGSKAIIDWEATGNGATQNTVKTPINDFRINNAFGFFILDFFIYMIAGLYFSRVWASDWGTPLPWYFPFQKSFWFPVRLDQDHLLAKQPKGAFSDDIGRAGVIAVEQKESGPGGNIEPVSEELQAKAAVKIRSLRREFNIIGTDAPFVAVNSLDLDMYEGQILALLGHNGAGKTTLLSMLTGMIPPTSGAASIYGHSISGNMESIRKIMGVCPQHDILFDHLTVKEHLYLYCRIKNVPSDQIDAAVNQMIEQVGLTEKANEKSGGLSGGMKRKLSVGIALIGDSKVVFLDEPTSGMDPYSRRSTWDLLKRKKEGRVIILTTHFMDEADQLGDRIAIMAKGKLQCCGSSLFLKSRYGVGYNLTIAKRATFNGDAADSLVHRHVPDAESLSDIAGEIQYRLPLSASPQFPDLFDEFDSRTDELGLESYSISVTTLEEVFLRVGHDLEAQPKELARQASLRRQHSRSGLQLPPNVNVSSSASVAPEEVVPVTHHNRKPTHSHNSMATPGGEGNGSGQSGETELQQVVTFHDHNTDLPSSNSTVVVKERAPANLTPASAPSEPSPSGPRGIRRPSISALNKKLEVTYQTDNLTGRHIHALLVKRWTDAKRNKRLWVFTILIPFLILVVGFAVVNILNADVRPSAGLSFIDQPYNHPLPLPYEDAALWTVPPSNAFGPFNTTASLQSPLLAPAITTLEPRPNDVSLAGVAANIDAFLLDQANLPTSGLSRYGAIAEYVQRPTPSSIIDQSYIWFNTTSLFGLPAFFNLHNNLLLQAITGNSQASIRVTDRPVPKTQNQAALTNSLTSIFIGIAFAFIPASFIHYSVGETTVKSKHQQMISGVTALSYWASNYIFDFVNYLIPAILCLICLAIFNISQLIGVNVGATILTIILYGLSIISFTYMISFLFSSPSTAQNVSLIFYILIGAFLLIASIVMDIIPSTQSVNDQLKFVYRLFPSFCFGEAIASIIVRDATTATGGVPLSQWDMNITGYPLIYMTWEIFVYFGVVLVIEYVQASPNLFAFFTPSEKIPYRQFEDQDSDVLAERERLSDPAYQKDMISMKGLRKVYPIRGEGKSKIAVHDFYLGIPEGQCFGLLGINGAGKSTLLKMLTNDIYPSAGDAYFNNIDIMKNAASVRRLIGYCPQFDALIGTLSAREHLTLFARIKGVQEALVPDYVSSLIDRLGLQEGIADRMSAGYSGGNKRKLCVGLALIGNPPIVLLDEPSTGMDPGSKRFMWDLIAATMRGRSVILTTHSMEECEALCQRVGIMVGGRFRCLGTTAHLKSKYGDGFQLDSNVHGSEAQQAFQQFVIETWPGSRLIEWHDQAMKFHIPKSIGGSAGARISIGSMFKVMEGIKEKFSIREYSVSETTLDQIFISFAKTQEEERGAVAGL